jgi:hypothetical protein
VTIQGQQDVVELQVTVNDTVLVEVLERQANLGSVEPRTLRLAFPSTIEQQC